MLVLILFKLPISPETGSSTKAVIFVCFRGFPGGPVVKNPPSNAGDVGSIPGWGTKIPHAAEKLKPACHNY